MWIAKEGDLPIFDINVRFGWVMVRLSYCNLVTSTIDPDNPFFFSKLGKMNIRSFLNT